MKVILNTGRTVWQGQAIESGKDLKMYINAAAICHMNRDQMEALGVEQGDNVKIKSINGEVIVSVVETKETLPDGMVYVPMGPWANRIVDPELNSTAMPNFKDTEVEITPTDEKVLDMPSLMKTYGKAGIF